MIALGGGGVDGHEVVVVEVHAIRAEFSESPHDGDGVQCVARGLAKRIAAPVADCPQAEGELV